MHATQSLARWAIALLVVATIASCMVRGGEATGRTWSHGLHGGARFLSAALSGLDTPNTTQVMADVPAGGGADAVQTAVRIPVPHPDRVLDPSLGNPPRP